MRKEFYKQKNQFVNDAFERIELEIHLQKKNNNVQTLLLCGVEPAVGTTTIAIDLAVSMAEAGWKTVLIDADVRKGNEYKRVHGEKTNHLMGYLRGKASEETILCETNYPNLRFVSAGDCQENFVSMWCSMQMQELLEKLKQNFDYIIFDAPSINAVVDAGIIANYTDATILVSAQGGSKKLLEQANEQLIAVNANVLGVVLNKMELSDYRRYLKNYNYFQEKKYALKKNHRFGKNGRE